MAVNKKIDNSSLSLEVQSGVDKAGDATYTKKSFSGLRNGVDLQNVFDVAESMSGILVADTRNFLINESSILVKQ